MERYIFPDVFDSRNQIRKADEFLYFSGEKVNLNQCDKKLSSGASMLWKKTVKSFPLLEGHLFEFTLGMVALQRNLLEDAGRCFYPAMNQNIIFSLSTLPTGKDGDTYTDFPAISAAAQLLI